jgi:hypothetical protein
MSKTDDEARLDALVCRGMNIAALKRIARELQFPVTAHRIEERKVPGEPRSKAWAHLTLACPCGREKRLWVSEDHVREFRSALTQHIAIDIIEGRL